MTKQQKNRAWRGSAAGAAGLAVNLLLAALKILTGVLCGGVAIVADGVNNLFDAFSCGVALAGFRLSAMQEDEEHPYGHGRMEYIAAMVIALLMAAAGAALLLESVPRIWRPADTDYTAIAFGVLGFSIVVKLGLAWFYRRLGKAMDSEVLRANFHDSLNDVLATSAVLGAALLTRLTGWRTDGPAGTLVALFIIFSAVLLLRDTARPLLGEGAGAELTAKVRGAVLAYEGIVGVHDLEVHRYGHDRTFATLHAEVPADRDLLTSHALIDRIERELRRDMGLKLTIHLDPVETDDPALFALKEELTELLKDLGPQVRFHDLRLLQREGVPVLLFDVAVPYGFPMGDQRICSWIQQRLGRTHPGWETYITVDKEPLEPEN